MIELKTHLKPETFIVFDIDNTLLHPSQELGNDQWFYHQLKHYIDKGLQAQHALSKALKEWYSIQFLTDVNIVEPGTDLIIRNLQDEGFKIIGLTTRGFVLSDVTRDQLETLHIDLSLTSPSKKEIYFLNREHAILFKKGILFTNGSHKGDAFFKFLEQSGYNPNRVVFINDKASHIREVEESCKERNVTFIGLRYGFLDEKVKSFQKDVADIQFQHFKQILSDEEVLKRLNN
jgi:FMN phosphatase YigB (HAD superfamily)